MRVLALLLMLAAVRPALAQDVSLPPVALLRTWAAEQTERLDAVETVDVIEHATWTLDGPFGTRTFTQEARVHGGRDVDGWEREIRSFALDGRPVRRERWDELQRRRGALAGRDAELATGAVVQLDYLLRAMEPAGPPRRDRVEGRLLWRFDLVPRRERAHVERVTLWLAPQTGHLWRSRALVRRRPPQPPFTITTDYTRVQGLDVPRQRWIEGTLQTRRRMRTYTMLFDYEATYHDHRLVFQDSG